MREASDKVLHMPKKGRPALVFVFSTRGSEWAGMGQQLYAEDPIFRDVLRRCDWIIKQHLGWSLVQELTRKSEDYRLHESEELLEPTLVAIQLALCEVWRSKGVLPDAVVGMSGGEFSAAYAAGALDIEDAMRPACSVSHVVQRGLGRGRMVSTRLSLQETEALRRMLPKPVYISAQYSATTTILAGAEDAIQATLATLSERNVKHWLIPTEFAFHSPLMDRAKGEFVLQLQGLRHRPARLPIYSSSTGGLLRNVTLDALHWWRVFRRPAYYGRAVRGLLQAGYCTFLEIGPQPILFRPIQETASLLKRTAVILPSMRSDQDAGVVIRESLVSLQSLGYAVNVTGQASHYLHRKSEPGGLAAPMEGL
jgi:acyl transferase domain-containing protein